MSGKKWDELLQRFFSGELAPPKGPVEPFASYEASPLFGRFDVKLDSHRRITMPVRFCKDTTSYALFPHPDGCLWCVPAQSIPTVLKELAASSGDNACKSAYSRLSSESLCTLSLNEKRQLILPADLVDFIGVIPGKSKVALLGFFNTLEIWNPVKLDKFLAKLEQELGAKSSKD